MSEFKTTAKDVPAPFVKRTAAPVDMPGGAVTVFFTKGENGKGWNAFAGDAADAPTRWGKTLDGAVLVLRSHLTDVEIAAGEHITAVTEAAVKGEAAEPVADIEPETETETDGSETGETIEPETAPKISAPDTDAERAAWIVKAVGEARDAGRLFRLGQTSSAAANAIIVRAAQEVTDLLSAMGPGERRERIGNYALMLTDHYYGITGGGDTVLSDAKRTRAGKKFRKVCAEYATAA